MEVQSLVGLPVLLALETGAGQPAARLTFSRDETAELAALVAADLHGLVPQVKDARLALAGSLFDQVELLRPGFPVWATLDELARRVPRGHLENVVAFGSHENRMPAALLEPDTLYAEGPMRLLPMSLLAAPAAAEELSDQLEVQLIGRGEAGTATADWLMRTLGIRLEHVRYLSRDDLLALTCVQYEHANLSPMWALLEAALLTPDRTESTMTLRGLPVQYANGEIMARSPSRWLAGLSANTGDRAHELAGVLFELRQYAALLDAHHLPLHLQAEPGVTVEAGDGFVLETLSDAATDYDKPSLFAHEAPGLGVVVVTVAQRGEGGRMRVLAHGYPLQPKALGSLLTLLTARYGCDGALHALGRIVLDDEGGLSAPATALH